MMKTKIPVVTCILILTNVLVFLLSFSNLDEMIEIFGISPNTISQRPYTILTHMFFHMSVFHLSGNMVVLFLLGNLLEKRIGGIRFFLYYLLSGFIAVLFVFLIQFLMGVEVISAGASGAIFGILFLAGAIAGWEDVKIPIFVLGFDQTIVVKRKRRKNFEVPIFITILLYVLLQLILLYLNFPDSISEFAHFGGIIGGVISLFLVLPLKNKWGKLV